MRPKPRRMIFHTFGVTCDHNVRLDVECSSCTEEWLREFEFAEVEELEDRVGLRQGLKTAMWIVLPFWGVVVGAWIVYLNGN